MGWIRFLKSNEKALIDWAILVIRIGIGIMFILHGYPKLLGGIERWTSLGMNGPGSIGIHFWYPFWGLLAALSEAIGGLFLVIGFQVRLSALMMLFTMIFAIVFHVVSGKGSPYHAIESAFIFIGIILSGSGKYTLQWIVKR